MAERSPMKRLLVISMEALSGNSSNGRTMMNHLKGYDKTKLAQFYFHGKPDADVCGHYFKVSDRNALNAFLRRKPKKEKMVNAPAADHERQDSGVTTDRITTIDRNCRTMLARDFVWRSRAWWGKAFERFLNEFQPEAILLQGSDLPYLFDLAVCLANRFSVPLLQYTSENYVLKKYLYMSASETKISHYFLKSRLKRSYKRFMERVDHCFYITPMLEADYQKVYPHPGKSTVLYTASDLRVREDIKPNKDIEHVVYCGNLGAGRAELMCQFAQVLAQVVPRAVFDVYGKFLTKEEEQVVCSEPNVRYHGFVPYAQVEKILQEADLLFHCENPNRLVNLKNGFTTKIADCLAVGTPFFIYTDKRFSYAQYLLQHNCVHMVETVEEMRDVLTRCRDDLEYRYQYIDNALALAEKNHGAHSNFRKVQQVLAEIYPNHEKVGVK